MAVTTSYFWTSIGSSFILNDEFTAGSQIDPAVASNAAGDRYFAAWGDPSNSDQVNGRIVNADQTPLTGEFIVNNTANAATQQYDPSVAGLTGGNFVVTYTDLAPEPDGDIRARLYTPGGNPLGSDFSIDNSTLGDSRSSVSGLSGGGFVVTYTRDFGLGSTDIRARTFDQNGNGLSGLIAVDSSAGGQRLSSVAGLSSGGFVAVWQDSTTEVYFRRFGSDGTALDANRVLIDTGGTINQDIHVVGLTDGGFAVAYTDNGWAIDGTEISFRIFNADGTTRTSLIRANSAALGGTEAGDQDRPTITTIGDLIVVGWRNADSAFVYRQVFDAQGNRLDGNSTGGGLAVEPEFAGLANGQLAIVYRSPNPEGAGLGDSIRGSMSQFLRTQTGDGADDVIVGPDDGALEHLVGGAGNDILIGGTGGDLLIGGTGSDTASYATAPSGVTASLANPAINTGHAAGDSYSSIQGLTGSAFDDTLIGTNVANTLTGGGGNDMIDGGAGNDTAVFGGNRADYRVSRLANSDIQIIDMRPGSPDGTDIVRAVEHFAFSNSTVTAAAVLLPPSVHWSASTDIGSHPAGWQPSLNGDFNGDGTSDALWFNAATNNVDIWSIQNGQWAGSSDVGSHPAGWQPSAAGDFNGDGTDDVLWFNPATNHVDIWTMANGQWAGSSDVGLHPPGYAVAGAGDFNNDGTSDVLWYNAATGHTEVWMLSDGHWSASVEIGPHPPGWQPAGVGDFNRDGTSDVLWHNPTTNDAEVWMISNGQWAGSVNIGSHPAGYHIAAVGDFAHDGTSDVLWYNPSNGDVDLWKIVDGHWAGSDTIGLHPGGWTPAGAGDFNQDGIADVLWGNAAGNRLETWLLGNS